MNKREEIFNLAEEVVADFELKRIPYQNLLMKCLRLCKLTNNSEGIKLFTYETSGYPYHDENNLTRDAWEIGRLAGRHFFKNINGKNIERMNSQTIAQLESSIHNTELFLKASVDPNVSISSSNPNQYVFSPTNNKAERLGAYKRLNENNEVLTKVIGNLYRFILNIRNSIVYGEYIETVFDKYKKDVDNKLACMCPGAIEKLSSAYENIQSGNEQNWNNAIHACRRLLQELADVLYPPTNDLTENGKVISLGPQNYKNRLLQYIKENKHSQTFCDVLDSSLEKIWNELDSIYESTNKGSHTNLKKEEAIRYLIHVYMLVSDILNIQ